MRVVRTGIDASTLRNKGNGCTRGRCDPHHLWHNWEMCGFGGWPVKAWASSDLARLLEEYETSGSRYAPPGFHSGYNEIVVSSWSVNEHLPQAISAFFMPTPEARLNDLGYGVIVDVVRAHSDFLRAYNLSALEVPLLWLNASNWEEPFSVYASGESE